MRVCKGCGMRIFIASVLEETKVQTSLGTGQRRWTEVWEAGHGPLHRGSPARVGAHFLCPGPFPSSSSWPLSASPGTPGQLGSAVSALCVF